MTKTHGPIEEEQRERMSVMARVLDQTFNGPNATDATRTIGFALLIYPLGEDLKGTGRINYIGNGNREHMLVALKELVARWEGRYADAGGAA